MTAKTKAFKWSDNAEKKNDGSWMTTGQEQHLYKTSMVDSMDHHERVHQELECPLLLQQKDQIYHLMCGGIWSLSTGEHF